MARKIVRTGLIFSALLLLDQLTKWGVFEKLLRIEGEVPSFVRWLIKVQPLQDTLASYGDFKMIEVTSFFNLVVVWNTGISFGVFQDSGDLMPYILSAFAAIVGLVLLVMSVRTNNLIESTAFVLIAAGATGNVWDRIRFKAVADFLDIHVAGYHWPAFNVADASITLGAALLIVYIVFLDKEKNGTS